MTEYIPDSLIEQGLKFTEEYELKMNQIRAMMYNTAVKIQMDELPTDRALRQIQYDLDERGLTSSVIMICDDYVYEFLRNKGFHLTDATNGMTIVKR